VLSTSTEFHISESELNVVLDSVNAAQTTFVSMQHFVSNMHDDLINEHPNPIWFNNLKSSIDIAIHELIKASTVI
jgi:hypothetical protein